ncbi:serine/threonine-protein kinase grp [Eurytemora carolleeae]|uniref:serine/threonine-protein kinase grp n=1 Tax=Eurytemora carolleeae TaxID=1294199 RepID=UPI000C76EDF2|nr:serine/threonine-protein kinase grp [Eurytemora carolleeae]|eukprot:XP_023345296.1 serine/threonine-protein kinase grp-like [Eurytemora affinis]
MVREFIEGWDLIQVLGEGMFGEVKLLVNKENGEACAMKEIDLDSHPEAEEVVKKEICVHKLLKHKNIVQCYGSRLEGRRQFIFLEYCLGGELFDRIEPDSGMPEHVAQRYFNSLICGIEYLHKKGVSHRDIKPENLLLDDHDTLKISDFGMATVFRHQGVERLLGRRCGTLPYIAPELLVRNEYNAEPADIWSCGMVLVAMLTGELPWDKPTPDQKEYMNWKDQRLELNPWKKIDHLPLSLLRKVLMPHPSRRYKLEQIQNHVWSKKKFKDADSSFSRSLSGTGAGLKKRLCSDLDHPAVEPCVAARQCQSQPLPTGQGEGSSSSTSPPSEVFHGFTQPAQLDNLLLSTQGGATQGSQNSFQRLVKRMTRFWVNTDKETTEKELRKRFEKQGYSCKMTTPGILTVQCIDRRGMQLVFKATLIEMDKQVLLDFRLSRGDGIEFKRRFTNIKSSMEMIIVKGPIMWSLAIHSDALPGV